MKYVFYYRKLKVLILGLAKIKLIDPIEVFYLVAEQTVIPIISKSGNSSIKLASIKRFNPMFTADFPGIHLLDPSSVTQGEIERLFFYSEKAYFKFCKNKKIKFIIRDPFDRFFSCFNGVVSGRNVLYRHPSGLEGVLGVSEDIDWLGFIKFVCNMPDYLSDRHFRSQSFYLPKNPKEIDVEIIEMVDYLKVIRVQLGMNEAIKINAGNGRIPLDKIAELKRNPAFLNRYSLDIFLYERISNQVSEE